ncbi:DEAD/DEAH box helicase [Actinoplanes subtropicus]|uniref:DEAD/DEAH box helicase n=1 Tax=Actinoplanes subtropicus TaxID=543632 RepID=UPI0004C32E6C|nr:DEAD/DEAH box helicase [Actinoplanes subtropicus]
MRRPESVAAGAAALPAPTGWQQPAVSAAVTALAGGGRGQIHAACGTGKTITAAHIAARLCPPGGIVVIACPTVALLAQTLAVAGPNTTATLAVCSDDTVADTAVHTSDLPTTVTTDLDTIVSWLRRPAAGARLIVTTHRSAGLLGQALISADRAVDVLVVDEAHHSAGSEEKDLALLHTDRTFPARRRLYLTATPRIDDTGDDTGLSMDDTDVFGPVLHRYTFAQAIADGWLDDYRVAVVGVSRTDLLPLIRELTVPALDPRTGRDGPLRTAMVAAALARAAAEFDLRRTIVYTPRIVASRAVAAALAPVAAALRDPARPARTLTCHHVDGRHNNTQRTRFLADLAAPPDDGWTVLCNVRCLGEGIDVPAVDSVAFSHPKSSTPEVIQAVGRALRRNRSGTGVATILIPVLVTDDAEASAQADADGYATVWQVVRALRAHDESLAAALDLQRQSIATGAARLPDKITVRLPDGYDIENYLRHLTVRMITATTSPWWEGYGYAARFHAEHGHLFVTVDHVTDGGYRLGQWVRSQRKTRQGGRLSSARIQALETLGMLWDPRGAKWEAGLLQAARYRDREGHLRISPEHITDGGYRLGQWVRSQRKRHTAGSLDAARVVALDRLGIEWDPYAAMWQRGITHAAAYRTRTGDLQVPSDYVDADGYRLGQFIVAQRMLYRRGTLAADRINALEDLGIIWHRGTDRFMAGLAHAREYHRLHHTLRMIKATTFDGYRLGDWLATQRLKLRAGKLAEQRITALDEISPTWRD